MRLIGRIGQLVGLGLPALAVLLELGGQITSGPMLGMLVFSVCCFSIGWIFERYFPAYGLQSIGWTISRGGLCPAAFANANGWACTCTSRDIGCRATSP